MHGISPVSQLMMPQTESLVFDINGKYLENQEIVPDITVDTLFDRVNVYAAGYREAAASLLYAELVDEIALYGDRIFDFDLAVTVDFRGSQSERHRMRECFTAVGFHAHKRDFRESSLFFDNDFKAVGIGAATAQSLKDDLSLVRGTRCADRRHMIARDFH